MITVTADYSWVKLTEGAHVTKFENSLAWQVVSGKKLIIAVGGPTQWAAPGPLPADAVVTNLITAATADPALAEMMWGAFLTYIFFHARPPWWRRDPLLAALGLFKEAVQLNLSDGATRAAVKTAIARSSNSRRFVLTDRAL